MDSLTDSEWESLVTQLEPHTVAEGEIERIRFEREQRYGSLEAHVERPRPELTSENVPTIVNDEGELLSEEEMEKHKEELEEQPKNEWVNLHGEPLTRLQTEIQNQIENNVKSTHPNTLVYFNTGVITNNGEIHLSYKVRHTTLTENHESLWDDLHVALEPKTQYNSFEIRHGNLELFGDGFDGTIFPRVRQPHEYYDEFETFEDWANAQEEDTDELRKRKLHSVPHFHPTEFNVAESDELYQWLKDCESILNDKVTSNSKNVVLNRVLFDGVIFTFEGNIRVSSNPNFDE